MVNRNANEGINWLVPKVAREELIQKVRGRKKELQAVKATLPEDLEHIEGMQELWQKWIVRVKKSAKTGIEVSDTALLKDASKKQKEALLEVLRNRHYTEVSYKKAKKPEGAFFEKLKRLQEDHNNSQGLYPDWKEAEKKGLKQAQIAYEPPYSDNIVVTNSIQYHYMSQFLYRSKKRAERFSRLGCISFLSPATPPIKKFWVYYGLEVIYRMHREGRSLQYVRDNILKDPTLVALANRFFYSSVQAEKNLHGKVGHVNKILAVMEQYWHRTTKEVVKITEFWKIYSSLPPHEFSSPRQLTVDDWLDCSEPIQQVYYDLVHRLKGLVLEFETTPDLNKDEPQEFTSDFKKLIELKQSNTVYWVAARTEITDKSSRLFRKNSHGEQTTHRTYAQGVVEPATSDIVTCNPFEIKLHEVLDHKQRVVAYSPIPPLPIGDGTSPVTSEISVNTIYLSADKFIEATATFATWQRIEVSPIPPEIWFSIGDDGDDDENLDET